MKKGILLVTLVFSALTITACGGEDENSRDDTTPSNQDIESQEVMSMNDMESQMDELEYTAVDFDVLYEDTEFEGEIENDDGLIEAEFYDTNKKLEERGAPAFDTMFPLIKNLEVTEEMTDEEAIQRAIKIFELSEDFLKAELTVVFSDGNEKVFEVKNNEV
ncbi:YusW-like protein [Salinibacillus kushneri]|uniref:YusW-like protein n=1 Tax=Salinibacillus kushneri TaxID=237682 RepID=A0A1I0F5X5_9BACI|nr:YusW family protein [Salinibacillus kushneri]SET53496.1 YusW-like protein [Salinibacillus kushneri]